MAWTKEKARKYSKTWYKANRKRQIALAKIRHKNNPEARRKSWLRVRLRTYGLTIEQYDAMLVEQDFRCKICGVHQERAPKQRLAVDHCHETGRVRGLLCNNCNALLGMAKDDLRVIKRALDYLCAFV